MGKIIRNGIKYSGTTDSANKINYDNSLSGLEAKTAQEAIDELTENFGGLRFGTDGEGNYGYFGADGSLIPFSSGGFKNLKLKEYSGKLTATTATISCEVGDIIFASSYWGFTYSGCDNITETKISVGITNNHNYVFKATSETVTLTTTLSNGAQWCYYVVGGDGTPATGGGTKGDVLWSNTASEIGAITVSIDGGDYNLFQIIGEENEQEFSTFLLKGEENILARRTGTDYIRYRLVSIASDGLSATFDLGCQTKIASSIDYYTGLPEVCVPKYVIGYKESSIYELFG